MSQLPQQLPKLGDLSHTEKDDLIIRLFEELLVQLSQI